VGDSTRKAADGLQVLSLSQLLLESLSVGKVSADPHDRLHPEDGLAPNLKMDEGTAVLSNAHIDGLGLPGLGDRRAKCGQRGGKIVRVDEGYQIQTI